MSWMKRPKGSPGTIPGPGQPPFNPNQQPMSGMAMPVGQQQPYFNYQPSQPEPNQQQYWQPQQQSSVQQQSYAQPEPQYNQTIYQTQALQQPNYSANQNTTSYQGYVNQEPMHNQNQVQQPAPVGYHQSYVPQPQFNQYNQPAVQQIQAHQVQATNQGKENWGKESWDWEWDENATKQQQQISEQPLPQQTMPQQTMPQQTMPQQTMPQQLQPAQPQVQSNNGMNANVLAESFGGTDSWNWPVEESHKTKTKLREPVPFVQTGPPKEAILENTEPKFVSLSNLQVNCSNSAPTVDHTQKDTGDVFNQNTHLLQQPMPIEDANVKTLNDLDTLKEHIPNLALGKRFKSDTLTPQWSIESQMSQESSDGPLTHSESTYPSNPSRTSSKSSPGPSADNTNFTNNYSSTQQVNNSIDEPTTNNAWSQQSDNPFLQKTNEYINPPNFSQAIPNQDIAESLKDMHIANRENPTPNILPSADVVNGNSSAPSISRNNETATSLALPPSITPPVSKNATPPPISLPSTNVGGLNNPFKRAGPLSHKTASKAQPLGAQPAQSISPQAPQDQLRRDSIPKPSNLTAPLYVDNTSQQANRPSPTYPTANLETTPDNSERPDQPQVLMFRPPHLPSPVTQNIVENLEVAPRNDRNEYLQTGHLSETDYMENINFTRNDPPPGLRRMVLGQQEPELLPLSLPSDDPPPGLSRMVTGQLTDAENVYPQSGDDFLDRQIDGQTTDNDTSRNQSYRQADGQQTPELPNVYSQQNTSRGNDRRPGIGLDRMVPGESNDYRSVQQFSNSPYSNTSDQRVVTGLEHYSPAQHNSNDFHTPDFREQNVDGSDYTENVSRSQPRSLFPGSSENPDPIQRNLDLGNYGDIQGRSTPAEPNNIREVVMEGENLQDLSMITPNEIPSIVDQLLDGEQTITERKVELSDSTMERPSSNSRSQVNRDRNTSGDDSERDKAFKSSPRRERRERKTSKDKDGYDRKEREGDIKLGARDRDDKRSERDRRGEDRYRDDRDDRRPRRSNRDKRYETEDTDYYSDREREKRRHREGSYTAASKPPRPDERDKRYRDDRDRSRRYATLERDRRYPNDYESERDEANSSRRGDVRDMTLPRRNDRDRRYDDRDKRYDERNRRYGDKKYYSLRREKDSDQKRGDPYSSPSRPDSRDPDPTEDDLNDTVDSRRGRSDRDRERRRPRRDRDRDMQYDPYYDRYGPGPAPGAAPGYQDPYILHQQQQQTYQYYENLRLTNPRAYMEVYNKVMAGQPLPPPSPAALAAANLDPIRSAASSFVQVYPTLSNSAAPEDRASVHSGRSSAGAPSKGNVDDSYYYGYRRIEPARTAPPYQGRTAASSIRTEFSGSRDFNTDASLNLQLEESTVRSERMTPFKYVSAHIKGNISSTNLVTVNPSYPGEGLPATVEIWNLNSVLKTDHVRCELTNYPGPLIKGVTHKKTIIAYCESKIRAAIDKNSLAPVCHRQASLLSGSSGSVPVCPVDLASYVLMWDLLILLLRQNGMVIGTDIAELLMKNKREYDHNRSQQSSTHAKPNSGSRRNSAASSAATSRSDLPQEDVSSPSNEQNSNAQNPDDDTTWNEPSLGADPSQGSLPRRHKVLSLKEQEKAILDKFREFLIFGNLKEALEWAMSQGLWGHALQLSAGIPDRRTRAAVAARFVSALSPADPLHTLYALMAARQPPAATCVSDEKWGDWRPHLSMILSNTSQRPEVDKRAITTLGDTLMNRGNIYAAHFCYVMARLDFGHHSSQPFCLPSADRSQPRLVLLGANHGTEADFARFSNDNERIAATEVYEYACSLSEPTVLVEFQVYKYLLATRLTDYGLYERALSYMEQLAKIMSETPHLYAPALLRNVLELAERLKYHDPSQQEGGALLEDDTESPQGSPRRDQEWLSQLRTVVQQIDNCQLPTEQATQIYEYEQGTPTHQPTHQPTQQQWYPTQTHSQTQYQQPVVSMSETVQTDSAVDQQIQYDQHNYYGGIQEPAEPPTMFNPAQYSQPQHDQSYLDQPLSPQSGVPTEDTQYGVQDTQYGGQVATQDTQYGGHTADSGYWNQENQYPYSGYNKPEKEKDADTSQQTEASDTYDSGRPQISMPNSTGGKSTLFDEYDTEDDKRRKNSQPDSSKQNNAKAKSSDKDTIGGTKQQSSGWFGGIFNFSFKPKNQMILPDDKNPSIVWDADRKRWKNTDGDDDDENNAALPPPPKMAEIANKISNSVTTMPSPVGPSTPRPASPGGPSSTSPPAPANSNIFKMQKSRHIKKSYVDVFNPSGAATRPLPPPSEVLGPAQTQPARQNYFVPTETQTDRQTPSMYDPNFYNAGS